MAPLSNAEKCRRYRERHIHDYRKADALRKKRRVALLKAKDPSANELRLKIQREKKREYRKKVSALKSKEIQSPPESYSFSTKAIKCRSLKKAVDALPRSSNKWIEIVQSLSKKFNLRIVLNKSPWRPSNDLSENEVEWLCKFMEIPDITYTNPGKKDQRYIGKENGKSKFVPIRYLLWTIRDLLEILNGCSLYKFLKQHEEFVFNKDIPQASCLREICENLTFLAKSISSKVNILIEWPNQYHLRLIS